MGGTWDENVKTWNTIWKHEEREIIFPNNKERKIATQKMFDIFVLYTSSYFYYSDANFGDTLTALVHVYVHLHSYRF